MLLKECPGRKCRVCPLSQASSVLAQTLPNPEKSFVGQRQGHEETAWYRKLL